MNEENLHFRIKEYILTLQNKRNTIEQLNNEFDELQKQKLFYTIEKEKLQKQFKILDQENKTIVNKSIKKNFSSKNVKIPTAKTKAIKRNMSSARVRNNNDDEKNKLKELQNKNKQQENILKNKIKELSNLVDKVNELELIYQSIIINVQKEIESLCMITNCINRPIN